MKRILIVTGLLTALAGVAAPEGYVSKSASGSSSATVYFEPPARVSTLVAVDVTSDKAASVLSWKVGAQQVSLLKAANSVTNLSITSGTVADDALLLAVTASGTMAALTAHDDDAATPVTNKLVTLYSPIGTNVAAGDTLRELSTNYTITAFTSTNIVSVTTNSTFTAEDIYVISAPPFHYETNQLADYVTNGASYELTFTNAIAFTPRLVTKMTTNIYTLSFDAAASADSLVLDLTNGLAVGDSVIALPTGGGAFQARLVRVSNYFYQSLYLTATNGVNFAVGDRLFVLGAAQTTPVGAATVRLFGDPIRVLPANVPGVLSVDGTSAVSINSATLNYGR